MQAKVPIDVLAFGELRGATYTRTPRADGHITAQTACIGEGIGRHGSGSRHFVLVCLESLLGRVGPRGGFACV